MKSVPRNTDAAGGRRLIRVAAVFGVAVSMALTACGSGESPEPGANNTVKTGEAPDYYPAEYKDVIAASKNEGGSMTIYSNTDQENWDPIFRDFKKKYPWVGEIAANNLDSDEVFQRVLSEQATAARRPTSSSPTPHRRGPTSLGARERCWTYKSPEVAKLPKQATLMPNVYSMSLDPLSIIYNTSLMTEKPTGLKSLADIVAKDPGKYQGKITCRDVNGAFGFTVSHAFTEARPDSWSTWTSCCPWPRRRRRRARSWRRSPPVSTWRGCSSAPPPRIRRSTTAAASWVCRSTMTEPSCCRAVSASRPRRRIPPPRSSSPTSSFRRKVSAPSPRVV